jgi:hypothetical protein
VKAVSTLRYTAAIAGIKPAGVSKFQTTQQEGGLTISLLGIDPVAYPQVSGLDFTEGDPQAAYAALAGEQAMIANGPLAATAGLEPGDRVRYSPPQAGRNIKW